MIFFKKKQKEKEKLGERKIGIEREREGKMWPTK